MKTNVSPAWQRAFFGLFLLLVGHYAAQSQCVKPKISALPKSQTLCASATPQQLTATVSGIFTASPQWYGPLADTTTAAFGTVRQNSLTYTPGSAQLPLVGARAYYAVVVQNGSGTCSDTAFVWIDNNKLPAGLNRNLTTCPYTTATSVALGTAPANSVWSLGTRPTGAAAPTLNTTSGASSGYTTPGAYEYILTSTLTTANKPCPDTMVVNIPDCNLFSLGNRIFADTDNSGNLSTGELGISDVVLQLFSVSSGGAQTPFDNPFTTAVDAYTVTTTNTGYYRFDRLPAGNYVVKVLASNFAVGGATSTYNPLQGFRNSTGPNQSATDPLTSVVDNDDNGLPTLDGAGNVVSGVITLGGNAPTGETPAGNYSNPLGQTDNAQPDNRLNATLDFGFTCDKPNAGPDITIQCTNGKLPAIYTLPSVSPANGIWKLTAASPAVTVQRDKLYNLVSGKTYELIYTAPNGGTICSDTIKITTAVCGPCAIGISKVTVSNCYYTKTGESKSTVSVEVAWTNAPPTDSIAVKLGSLTRYIKAGYPAPLQNTPLVSPQVVAFEMPADASTGSITAVFQNNTTCTDTKPYTLPAPCVPLICDGIKLGGTVFNDYDADGIKDAGETDGVFGIDVIAIACDNTKYTTTTDVFGKYLLNIPANKYPVRVEFSKLPAFAGQGTPNGSDGRTSVQFVKAAECNVDFGVADPNDFCQDNPSLTIPCYVSGDPLAGGNAGTLDALVAFPYSLSGLQDMSKMVHIATADQVGSLWATTYSKETKKLFSAATLKRHVGLGPLGLGGLYVSDLTNINTPVTTNFIDVSTIGIPVGTVGSNTARGLSPDYTISSIDLDGWNNAGKVGIGGLDISENSNRLYLMNIADKKLYEINITGYNTNNTLPTAANVKSFTVIPNTTLATGTLRPWAVKYYKGKVYVGYVNDASISRDKSDLRAFVYSIDPTTVSGTPTLIFDFPLTYPKGQPFTQSPITGWYPWNENFNDKLIPIGTAGLSSLDYPEPILADLEFDLDGSMVLGFADRTGIQAGAADFNLTGTSVHSSYVGGDILRAFASGNTFVLENNGKVGDATGNGPNNNQGPGSGEFYNDDFRGATNNLVHTENALGGLTLKPGSGEVISSAMDPLDIFTGVTATGGLYTNAGGVRKMSNSAGVTTSAYIVYNGNTPGTLAKASGLGEIDITCDKPLYLEIGNRVWLDEDKDGEQDACEKSIAGVNVALYRGTALVATTITNADGEYYFSTKSKLATGTWSGTGADTTLRDGTTYRVVFGTGGQFLSNTLTVSGSKLLLTTANATGGNKNDFNDSDAANFNIAGGTFPSISVTVSTLGSVNHSLDAGFYCVPSTLAAIKATPVTCTNNIPNSNGKVKVSGLVNVDKFAFSKNSGGKFTGAAYAAATATTADSVVLNNLPNPATAAGDTFYVRLYNGLCCFKDTSVVLGFTDCACVKPLRSVRVTDPGCSTTGKIEITAITNGNRYGISNGATYTVPAYANATVVGTLPISVKSNIANTADSVYTIRVFNGTNTCFVDTTVTVKAAPVKPTILQQASSPFCRSSGTQYTIKFTATGGTVTTVPSFVVTGDSVANIPIGTASVKLTVTSAAGCTESITVNAPTNCVIPCNAPTPTGTGAAVCGSGSVTLTAAGCTTGYTAKWFTSAAGTTAAPGTNTGNSYTTPTISTTTNYYVLCQDNTTATCKSAITTVTATVNPKPTIVQQANSPFCRTAGTQYTIKFTATGGTVTTLPSLTVTADSVANIPLTTTPVRLVVTSSAGCTDTITVNAPTNCVVPCNAPRPTGTGAAVCGSGSVTLTATGCTTGFTARWFTNTAGTTAAPGTNTGNSYTTPTISATTNYYVLCQENTRATCKSATRLVTATVNPKPTIVQKPNSPFCRTDGTQYTIKFTATGGTVTTLPNFAVTGDSVANIPIGTASVKLVVTSTAGCADTITVNAPTNCVKPTGSIGDLIWKEATASENGIYNPGTDTPVKGVILQLFRNGVSTGRSDTTDVNGTYGFAGLDSASYYVQIIVSSIPSGFKISTMIDVNTGGGNETNDSDFSAASGRSNTVVIDPTNPQGTALKDNLNVDGALVAIPACPEISLVTPNANVCRGSAFPALQVAIVNGSSGVGVAWYTNSAGTGTPLSTMTTYTPLGTANANTIYYVGLTGVPTNCGASSPVPINVTVITCIDTVDLALKKLIAKKLYQLGDTVTYTIKVWNESGKAATGVEATDSLNTGITFISSSATRGAYNAGTKVWTIGNIAANGDTVTLTIKAKVVSAGLWFNTAEISKLDQKDRDSTPGNNQEGEDDLDRQCFTVPIKLCLGKKVQVSIAAKYTNVKWFKNNVEVAALAGQNTVSLSAVGTYTYTADNNTCPASGCCPIIIEAAPTIADGTPTTICAGASVDLTTKITGYAALQSPVWTIGTASGAAVATPTSVKPTATTTYVLVVQNTAGCKDTANVVVTVNPKPNAGTDQTLACADPKTNTLTTSTTLSPVTTGGTFTQIGTTPAVATITGNAVSAMSVAGTYQFQYSVLGCLDTVAVTVQPCTGCVKPNAGPDAVVCQPTATSKLTAITAGGTWAVQSGNPATTTIDANGNVAGLSAAGTYKFVYSVTGGGIICTDTAQVVVNAKPIIEDGTPTTICAGASVNLNTKITGYSTLQNRVWTIGTAGGTPVTTSTAVRPAATTTYVLVAQNAAGCKDTANVVVTVNPKPDAGKDTTMACTSANGGSTASSLQLAATPTGGTWAARGGNPTGATVNSSGLVSVTYATAKGKAFEFVYTKDGCRDTVKVTVPDCTIPCVKPSIGETVGQTLCQGDAAGQYTFPDPDAGANNYQWYTFTTSNTTVGTAIAGATGAFTPTAAQLPPANGTTYYYAMIAKAKSGAVNCSDTVWAAIKVNAKPVIADGTPTTICAGSSVDLTTKIRSYANLLSPVWTIGTASGATVATPTSVKPTATTTYVLVAQNTAGCKDTANVVVTVNPKPNAGTDQTLACADPKTNTLTTSTTLSPVTTGGTFTQIGTTPAVATITGNAVSAMSVAGTYQFQYSVLGCLDTVAVTVQPCTGCVKPNAGPDVAVCQPTATSKLTAITSGGTWAAQSGNPATATIDANGNVAGLSAAGTYKFVYSVTGGGVICTDTAQVVVNAKPVIADGEATTICAGGSVDLTTKITGYANLQSPVWTIGTASGVAAATPTSVKPTATTTYVLVAQNAAGCKDTANVLVTVTPKPNAGRNQRLACGRTIPTTIDLVDAATGQKWKVLSVQPNTTVQITTPQGVASGMTAPGTYRFVLQNQADSLNCRDTVSVIIPNCNCPTISVIAANAIVCKDSLFPTLNVMVMSNPGSSVGVNWYADATGGSVLSSSLSFKPSGLATVSDTFYVVPVILPDDTTYANPCLDLIRTPVIVTVQNCDKIIDLALKKGINTKIAKIGDELIYTIKVFSQPLAGSVNATGVEVMDSIATTVQFVTGSFAASRGNAVINGNVIKWSIGGIAANTASNGDTVTLTYKVKATMSGLHFNTAEISKTNEKDKDSTPGNGKDTEDDLDRQCFTVPFNTLCSGEKVLISAPSNLTNVVWSKTVNGQTTAAGSGNEILVSEVGSYTFTATNKTCPASGCCPVIIEPGINCCPANICVPFTVKKIKKR